MATGEGSGKRRPLTDLEARYVGTALALAGESESERFRHSGLPHSTYHYIRARALSLGWLSERYVPDPVRMGWPRVTFTMATLHGGSNTGPGPLWAREGTASFVWQGVNTVFGVFFYRTVESQQEGLRRLKDQNHGLPTYSLPCEVTPGTIPVYFDYEGIWNHLIGLPGVSSYPSPLSPPAKNLFRLTDGDRKRLAPFVAMSSFDRILFGMERRTRRLQEKGFVNMRSFLNPTNVPSYQGRSLDYVAMVRGKLRSGTAPELLSILTGSCRVYPFLYAFCGENVVFGAIGQGGEPPRDGASRRSVKSTLQERLVSVETHLEPLPTLQVLVDHRYTTLTEGP